VVPQFIISRRFLSWNSSNIPKNEFATTAHEKELISGGPTSWKAPVNKSIFWVGKSRTWNYLVNYSLFVSDCLLGFDCFLFLSFSWTLFPLLPGKEFKPCIYNLVKTKQIQVKFCFKNPKMAYDGIFFPPKVVAGASSSGGAVLLPFL